MRTWGASVLLTLVVACGSPTSPAAAPAPSLPPTVPVAPTTPSPRPTLPAPPKAPRTAGEDLVRFLAAATATDVALDRVAADPTADAVAAVDLARVAAAIPAGLDRELLQAALVVYGDLVSRRAGLRVAVTRPFADDPKVVRRGLANAGAAAGRYAADVTALVRLARTRPPLTAVPPTSRAAAEVAVRAEWIRLLNAGCAGEGGVIPARLHPVTWRGGKTEATRFTGRVEGVPFTATWTAASGWKVAVEAC